MEKPATADLLVARRAGSGRHEPAVRGSDEVVGAVVRADGS